MTRYDEYWLDQVHSARAVIENFPDILIYVAPLDRDVIADRFAHVSEDFERRFRFGEDLGPGCRALHDLYDLAVRVVNKESDNALRTACAAMEKK